MPQPRQKVAWASHPLWGLVYAGGSGPTGVGPSLSLEVYQTVDGAAFTRLADLPAKRSNACMAIIDGERLMVVGGKQTSNKVRTMGRSNPALLDKTRF